MSNGNSKQEKQPTDRKKEEKEKLEDNKKKVRENKDNNLSDPPPILSEIIINDDGNKEPNKSKNNIDTSQKIKVEKEETNINYVRLNKCKIEPLYTKSKYNVFFIFIIQESFFDNLSLSTYFDNSFFMNSYINYKYRLIYEKIIITTKKTEAKYFIVQAPIENPIKKLSISLWDKKTKKYYNGFIDIKDGNNNYFYLKNIDYDQYNDFLESSTNSIFRFFLEYFFDENNKIENCYQKDLIESLMREIEDYYEKKKLKIDTLLRFLKYCRRFECQLKDIQFVELIEERNEKRKIMKHEFCLTSKDIDKLIIKNQRNKLIDLIVEIYANYDNECLLKLIKSEKSEDYCKSLLNLLSIKQLKFNDLSFEDLKLLQQKLLPVSTTKKEIQLIIKLIKGLTNNLTFIKDNCNDICLILENNKSFYKLDKYNYLLNVDDLTKEDNDINKIFQILQKIMNLTGGKKYSLLNLEEIFYNMVVFYSNYDLNVFCELHKIAGLLKNAKIYTRKIDDFYNKVHQKGMNLIKNKKMSPEAIINFINSQDIFYYNPTYNRDNNRDPAIFEYILITDEDKNYLETIKLLKENKLWDLFSKSDVGKQKQFQEALIGQIKKVKDFKSIFDIFPIENIDQSFTFLINGKMRDLIYTVLDEKEKNYNFLFEIFDDWFICNDQNYLDLNFVINLMEMNYILTSKYYFHLLENKKMQ